MYVCISVLKIQLASIFKDRCCLDRSCSKLKPFLTLVLYSFVEFSLVDKIHNLSVI